MIAVRTFFLLVLLITSSVAVAQQKDEQGIYLVAEKMPEIKGGVQTVAKKLKYPKQAKVMQVQGVVYVGFIVTEEGKVKEPKILRPLGAGCDEEALRVVEELEFVPGYHQGKAVPVRFVLPIRFRLKRS
ncbi:MAG: energy transducer TonB [Candidatus Marinimicrobia bacterium]|jgi:protein TonB|nr:energy transducer TonB [Candidatus Neomarinimicrobiota bacterium]MDP6593182.1 energy transducer TonB [Candidatus Neomarinimicrobiota bacterium]MDP6836013.1 energy transducer TonB [Candidatus Neomarinimicrobiota bacterium]MDP6966864.1 energy transducer TonB [Candidatus Neomarinimicrobiota bacterium]|tara:strand:- start:286 stop:672 length:387 start_codon:yes stop_codon:yes gene_type:complete